MLQLEIYQENNNVILTARDGMTKTYLNTTVAKVKMDLYRIIGAEIEWTTFPLKTSELTRPIARKADGKPNKLCYTLANAK